MTDIDGVRLVLVAGSTETAAIDGLSAAGAAPDLLAHTPPADAEIVTYGETVRAPAVPESPSGCLTPAVPTRAVRELVGFDVTVVDGGLAAPTGAPTVSVGAAPGGDVRAAEPVPSAREALRAARDLGRGLPDDDLLLAESIPGGTTTALGVLRALGEPASVSSSLPANPIERKRAVVAAGLAASDLEPGGAAGEPRRALRLMGDPVLATLTGLALGALEAGTAVTLAGGTQLIAVAALLRHADVGRPLSLATTTYVADDASADLAGSADQLDVDLTVTDPGFAGSDHPAMAAYGRGEAKEGVGLGGALALAERAGVPMTAVRDRVAALADAPTGSASRAPAGTDGGGGPRP